MRINAENIAAHYTNPTAAFGHITDVQHVDTYIDGMATQPGVTTPEQHRTIAAEHGRANRAHSALAHLATSDGIAAFHHDEADYHAKAARLHTDAINLFASVGTALAA